MFTGSRLTRDTVLCPWARYSILCIALFQPRKRGNGPYMTECKIVDWTLSINTNKTIFCEMMERLKNWQIKKLTQSESLVLFNELRLGP